MTDIDTYNDHCEMMTMHQQSRLPRRGVRIPTIIMILFLLVVFGALAFGQNVTITRLDGSTLMIPSTIGGTRAAPVAENDQILQGIRTEAGAHAHPGGGEAQAAQQGAGLDSVEYGAVAGFRHDGVGACYVARLRDRARPL